MPDPSCEPLRSLEALTEAASAAAAKGEWNIVEAYYRRREAVLAHTALQPDALARVQALDQEVTDRARLAQAGVASLLQNATIIRQRLKGLRQWNGGGASDSGTIERHI